MSDERAKLLEAAIAQIEKSYGKGSIMRLGSTSARAGERDSIGLFVAGRGAGRGRLPARTRNRGVRAGSGR